LLLPRTRLRRIESLGEVAGYVASVNPGVVLIVDVDNTLVPQGLPPDEFRATVDEALDWLDALSGVRRVIAITNGPHRGVDRLMARGNKPWTSRRRLGLTNRTELVVVVGDQVLTDGLLAWRLGGVHLHMAIDEEHEPSRQAIMRRVGKVLERVLFFEEDLETAG